MSCGESTYVKVFQFITECCNSMVFLFHNFFFPSFRLFRNQMCVFSVSLSVCLSVSDLAVFCDCNRLLPI